MRIGVSGTHGPVDNAGRGALRAPARHLAAEEPYVLLEDVGYLVAFRLPAVG